MMLAAGISVSVRLSADVEQLGAAKSNNNIFRVIHSEMLNALCKRKERDKIDYNVIKKHVDILSQ